MYGTGWTFQHNVKNKWWDIFVILDMSLSKLWESVTEEPGMIPSMQSQRVRHDLATEQQKNNN